MSITAISWALSVKTGSPSAKLVLIKLADNANDDGKCWPSVRHIVDQTELSERAVREHIKTLECLGFLTVEKRFSEGVRLPNVYNLNLRQNVGVVHQMQDPPAPDAPGVVQEVQGNSKPSKINRHLTEDSSETLTRSEPVILLPTNRFETLGEEYPITKQQSCDYVATYPGVDVDQQLRTMRRWLIDNPSRRKTSRGMAKFVNSWLMREQDKSPRNGNGHANGRKPTPLDIFIRAGDAAVDLLCGPEDGPPKGATIIDITPPPRDGVLPARLHGRSGNGDDR